VVTKEEGIESHHRATQVTHLRPLRPPFPQSGAHNSQSKLISQIAVRLWQIQRWFMLLTAYGNIPSPYPTLLSPLP